MDTMPAQDGEGGHAADTGIVHTEAFRELTRMLESEMAKSLQATFEVDFERLMQRIDTRLTAEHAAMDDLLRRLRAG